MGWERSFDGFSKGGAREGTRVQKRRLVRLGDAVRMQLEWGAAVLRPYHDKSR